MKTTERTMKHLKKNGISHSKSESYNSFSNKKNDLFGIIDIVALYSDGICGIQACGSDFLQHDRKIKESPYSLEWIDSGGILELWGWRKLKVKRGGKAFRWTPRIKKYYRVDFL